MNPDTPKPRHPRTRIALAVLLAILCAPVVLAIFLVRLRSAR